MSTPNNTHGRRSRRRVLLLAGLAILLLASCAGVAYFGLTTRNAVRDTLEGWKPATKSVTKGDLRMGVLLVAELDMSAVFVLAENRSETRKIDFVDNMYGEDRKYDIKITDEFGNKYKLPFPLNANRLLTQSGVGLRPGEFTILLFPCTSSVAKAKYLYVEVPSLDVESQDVYKFKVPIKAETVTYTHPNALFGPKQITSTIYFKRNDYEEWISKHEKGRNKQF
jgi:hypothetical protein